MNRKSECKVIDSSAVIARIDSLTAISRNFTG